MTAPEPAQAEPVIQATVGLADTPLGQRVALTITVLLGKEAAAQVAAHIVKIADGMSSSGLITAQNGAVPQVPG